LNVPSGRMRAMDDLSQTGVDIVRLMDSTTRLARTMCGSYANTNTIVPSFTLIRKTK